MLRRLREENSVLDLFRLVLLSLIVVSWMVVMSVGGLLILQSYGQEVGDGAPFADQAKTVFALKRGQGAGFSGLVNTLFFLD